jgi:putative inorganic carbon (hco3(-)) transporter
MVEGLGSSKRLPLPPTWPAVPLAVLAGLLLAWLPLNTAVILLGSAAVLLLVAIQPLAGLGLALLAGPWGAHESLLFGNQIFDSGQLLLLLTLAAWIGRNLAHRRLTIPQTALNLPFVLFLTVATLTLFQATSWGLAIKELIKWLEMLLIMWMVVDLGAEYSVLRIPYSVAASKPTIRFTPYAIRYILFILLLAALTQAAIGIWQFSRGTGVEHFQVLGRFYRAYGTFYQPNPFGGFMALNAALAAGAFIGWLTWSEKRAARTEQRGASSVKRLLRSTLYTLRSSLLLAFCTAVTTAGLLVSWSRGAWLGFAAAAATLAFFWPRRRWLGIVLLLLAAGLLLVAGQLNLLPSSITSRVTSFAADFSLGDARGVDIFDENYAIIERLAHWQGALAMSRDYPWLGVGFGNYEAAYPQYRLMNWTHPLGHAHNYYLNIMAETGFLGAAAYLLFWAAVIAQSLRQLGRLDWPWRGLALGLLAAWVYLSVHHLVDKLYVNNIYIHLGAMLGLQQLLDRGTITVASRELSALEGNSAGQKSGMEWEG